MASYLRAGLAPPRHRLRGGSSGERLGAVRSTETVQTLPVAPHAPAGAEPWHQRVPPLRLHPQGDIIADRTAVAIRKDEEEHDGRHDNAQREECDKDNGEYHGRHIQESDFD